MSNYYSSVSQYPYYYNNNQSSPNEIISTALNFMKQDL